MNIFVLDTNPRVAAEYHNDRHVVKMILETAQLLSTAHHLVDGYNATIYMATHRNHPCAKWVRETSENYNWTFELLKALLDEYTYRYGRHHATERLVGFLAFAPKNIKQGELTPFAQAMPEECKDPNAIKAYHNYYNSTYKSHLRSWTKRKTPHFMKGGKV